MDGKIAKIEDPSQPIWCVVGNIADEILYSEDKQLRTGTKHFAPGTKIYCYPPLWDIWKGIKVIGRHRGSHRFATMVINLHWLVNYCPKLAYHPHILSELNGYWDGTEESKKRAENLVGIITYWKMYKSQKISESSSF